MKYQGSCHCGGIAYEAEGDIERLLECNCSICSKKGSLLWFVPRDHFKLITPESQMKTYTFNKKAIQHTFCPTCGCAPFGFGVDPQGSEMAAINARCLDNVDLTQYPVDHFDGRSF